MSENPFISIVMPCYNCATTLREAFQSIYKQNFTYPFEVVLVDDGSTDNTIEVIQDLIKEKSECKFIQHDKNKGGGATRNTAIKASKGEIIFCLDSDDVLADNSLPPMIEYLQRENLDGVIFQHRRFFNDDVNKYKQNSNPDISREIVLSDIFEASEKRLLFNNFVYTRNAYEITGGYPEDHGFDTQCFEYKFLAKGLKAKICPNSIYYHRQATKKSYFDREYEKGLFSINTYLALEPVLESLSNSIIDLCVKFDIFRQNDLKSENNLLSAISKQYVEDNKFLLENDERDNRCKSFIESTILIRQGSYQEALLKLKECVSLYETVSPLILFNIIRSLYGSIGTENVNDKTLQWLQNYGILKAQKIQKLPPSIARLYSLWKKLLVKK